MEAATMYRNMKNPPSKVVHFRFCWAVSELPKTARSAHTQKVQGSFELFRELYMYISECQGKKEALGRIANVVCTNWQSRNVQFQQAFIAEYTYIIE